ncbi:MAG: triose-phosphate isomerase [Verrucomicrobia bacterium]|nr:triose-phosphate isomerase [Verrucomicrobiota bacterium]
MKRIPLIAGNWKMYKTRAEAQAFIADLLPLVASAQRRIFIAPPFTAIEAACAAARGSKIVIGAQNVHDANEGAFTGEVSCRMLKELGAAFVIIGHSERRTLFSENDTWINRKLKRALSEGIIPILCIGETFEQREVGSTDEVLFQQMEEGLQGVTKQELKSVIIAYEPIWAIGTGKTATPEMAQAVHRRCRLWVEKKYGLDSAEQLYILYGGSVKPDNIAALMQEPDIDGALVGGAALDPRSFAQLINF